MGHSFVDAPVAPQAGDREFLLDRYSKGSPSFRFVAVEADGRFRKGMAFASLTRFEGLDALLLKAFNVRSDPFIEDAIVRGWTHQALLL